MNKGQLEATLATYITKIKADFYAGGDFQVFGCYDVVPVVEVADNHGNNATLSPTPGGQMGVEVNQGLFTFCSDESIKLAAAHELGHAFSARVLENIGMKGADGAVSEIIADLGAAYLMNGTGSSWDDVRGAVRDGIDQHIFDAGWDGDHPPAQKRRECIEGLADLMEAGMAFEDAAKAICLSCGSLKP